MVLRARVRPMLASTAMSAAVSIACAPDDASHTGNLSGQLSAGQTEGITPEDCSDCAGACDAVTGTCWPECVPGDTRVCYSGDPSTLNVGACVEGEQRCDDEGQWEAQCTGEVVPSAELCGNGLDDDCDGATDDTDLDEDGFGVCSGDCCDADGGGCIDARFVNPGAYEVGDNGVDDDCDGDVDEPASTCDATLASNSSAANDYAFALDLCQTTIAEPSDPLERTWGLIDAQLSLADGSGKPRSAQHAIRPRFGSVLSAVSGDAMVLLSSGHAAAPGDAGPSFREFQPGIDLETQSAAPSDWLAAHGGAFPNPAGCAEPWSTSANDPVMLTLRVRAPTNARSFSLRTAFFSAEYPEWVCSEFNDFFVALLDSQSTDNPADRNIAIYDDGATHWPVGVNLVMVADGLFTQCQNGPVGCATDVVTSYDGCGGFQPLLGTGFDSDDDACGGAQDMVGGGTGWLTMHGNVTPGEVFELRLAIWDSSGHIFDSLVLLDDWTWSIDAASPGVTPG